MSDRRFGFRQLGDTRDLRYSMPMKVGAPSIDRPQVVRYKPGPVLDQGREGACAGYSVRQILNSEPFRQTKGPSAREIYLEARVIDEFDDDEVESGTSVRAALQVAVNNGLIESFHWAPDMESVLNWLWKQGPVDVGSDWYSYSTFPDGRVVYSGTPVGGHSYPFTGYDLSENVLIGINSWGPSFGFGGEFYAPIPDVIRQMGRGAVIAGVIERPRA